TSARIARADLRRVPAARPEILGERRELRARTGRRHDAVHRGAVGAENPRARSVEGSGDARLRADYRRRDRAHDCRDRRPRVGHRGEAGAMTPRLASLAPGNTRSAAFDRRTTETQIKGRITIDGQGKYAVRTGIRFFDHMLELFTRHGGF